MRLVSPFYLVFFTTIACNQSPVDSNVGQPPPAADNVDCLDDGGCAGQIKSTCYRLPGQKEKGTCARWCSTDDFCGPPGTGAMCLKKQGAAPTDGGICVQWATSYDLVLNWQAGKAHCNNIKTQTERWVMPTIFELEYLCRSIACPFGEYCDCSHARGVLGSKFPVGNSYFWSSTCYDETTRKESRVDDSSCVSRALQVRFSIAGYFAENVGKPFQNIVCLRPN